MSPHTWPAQGFTLRHFAPSEFDHPDKMEPAFLRIVDELAERSKATYEKMFPGDHLSIKVTDDYRTQEDLRVLYAAEIKAGKAPPDSAHLRGRALDLVPICDHEEAAQLIITHEATGMWIEGLWPGIGWEVGTRHLHGDSDGKLIQEGKRPQLFPGVSR